jgi:hypothetical protein
LLYDDQRAVTGLRFAGGTALNVASRPIGPDASAREIVERFDVATGRRVLGPVTLASRRQASPLLSMRDGRVLTESDGQLVIRDGGTSEERFIGVAGPRSRERRLASVAVRASGRAGCRGDGGGVASDSSL